MIAKELQAAGVMRRDQHLEKQPAEQRREHFHCQEIVRTTMWMWGWWTIAEPQV